MKKIIQQTDWILMSAVLLIIGAGLSTVTSFGVEGGTSFFTKQLIFTIIALFGYGVAVRADVRLFKEGSFLMKLFFFFVGVLLIVLVLGHTAKGAKSWLNFGFFSFQPVDMVKLLLVFILAKYFSRRHVEIAQWKHIFISGVYMFIPFLLVFMQPDFGSAMVIFSIWGGMLLVSGLGRKQLLVLLSIGTVAFFSLWLFVFKPYQKARIHNFFNPYADVRGSGYNVYQSTIAVGSGRLIGKGVGLGTQSRLQFLPEYQTDFVFAAFAEEWGFVGSFILIGLYAVVIWRMIHIASRGATNFEILFGVGLALYFMTHIIINIGMNIGIMPVTGIPLPFMSYGGSHLITELLGIGFLMSIRGYGRATHRDRMKNEFLGIA